MLHCIVASFYLEISDLEKTRIFQSEVILRVTRLHFIFSIEFTYLIGEKVTRCMINETWLSESSLDHLDTYIKTLYKVR